MVLYLSFAGPSHDILPTTDGGNLHGAFGGDSSSRVVELDDDDLTENLDLQAAAPMYQQPRGRHPPVLDNKPSDSYGHTQGRYAAVLPNFAVTVNQQPVSGPSRPAPPYQDDSQAADDFNPAAGMDADFNNHARYHPHASAGAIYGTRKTYIQHPSMYFCDNTNANMGATPRWSQQQPPLSNTAYFAPVDAGSGFRSSVDTPDWPRAAQESDVLEHGHGKLV